MDNFLFEEVARLTFTDEVILDVDFAVTRYCTRLSCRNLLLRLTGVVMEMVKVYALIILQSYNYVLHLVLYVGGSSLENSNEILELSVPEKILNPNNVSGS